MDLKRIKRLRREGGFTLTEIMVVIFIIGLLSTVVLFNVLGARTDAQVKTAQTNITRLANALEQYSLDMYDYPSQRQGLEALVTRPDNIPSGASYRQGGYITKLPMDPWGRPFVYERPGDKSGRAYDLYSYGADGKEGGEELDADIGNWDN
ncbi:type II secretion system major pseudopilin GspG [Hyphomonas sp. FCG-A18]|uniref:type II secretion system major pseudopilin GspG n=1 Tax=Hyphomonas sp. FCG-A18 TaxID=3080019 RepID=UPI002B2C4EA1|nr:type II secretion system major pseudopilin GspG [Hyphomonas sp. FCG-A18]